ncbi:hypothetical protein PIB30_082631, partial [Stylosanthes scabra]|nr:hypothetical protein [Stylosanthes scabra]
KLIDLEAQTLMLAYHELKVLIENLQRRGAKIQQRVVQFMEESGPPEPFKGSNATEELKRKTFGTLFQNEAKKGHGGSGEADQIAGKSVKKQWGFEGFKKWKII